MGTGSFKDEANSVEDKWALYSNNAQNFEWKLSDSIGSFLPDSFEAVEARDSGYPHHINVIPLLANPEECIGRSDEIESLHSRLMTENLKEILLVNGESGVGKTTLLKAYLTEYQNHFEHLIWVDYQLSMVQSFVDNPQLNDLIDLPLFNPVEAILAKIVEVLNSIPGPNLLVIDCNHAHLTHQEVLNVLPIGNRWKRILICREATHQALTFVVNGLTPEFSLKLFKGIYSNGGKKEINDLLQKANHNPLRIKLFALFLEKFQGKLPIQNLLGLKEINFDSIAQYLLQTKNDESISSQITTWLSLGNDKELIKDVIVHYLDKQAKDKEAGLVMSAWLDAGGDSEIIRRPIKIYLDKHVTDAESYSLIMSWLDATNNGFWVNEQINTYLNLYSKTKNGGLLKQRWNNQKFKNISRLKDLIANGNLKEALIFLESWAPNHFRDEIIMQHGKLIALENNFRLALIDYSTKQIETARATNSLMSLIQRLEVEAIADHDIQKTEVKEPSIHIDLLTKAIFLFIHAFNELLDTSLNEKDLFWSDLNHYDDIKPVLLENFNVNDLVQSFTDHNQNLYFAHISN